MGALVEADRKGMRSDASTGELAADLTVCEVQAASSSAKITVDCHGMGGGSLTLSSAGGGRPSQTDHLRGSVRLTQQPLAVSLVAASPGTTAQPGVPAHVVSVAKATLAAVTRVAAAGLSERKAVNGTAGVTAGVALSALHLQPGYRMHPAAADAALHTGAVNPAAPPGWAHPRTGGAGGAACSRQYGLSGGELHLP